MKKISGVVISFNEEDKIAKPLSSLQAVSNEIVVVDSFSSDQTEKICRRYTDRFLKRKWSGYRDQKEFATLQASFDWVLSLDADEVLSAELQEEICRWKVAAEERIDGYYIGRKTFFMGRWIKHTTWYPDWQMRLFRKSAGCWEGRRVHESFRLGGPTGYLSGSLEHYTYATMSEYLQQLDRFSSLAAADYQVSGVKAGMGRLFFYPPMVFFVNYFLRRGFQDGLPGLTVSTLSAISTFFKYLKLWEIQLRVSERADDQ